MKWYQISIQELLNDNLTRFDYKEALSNALDVKYGDYDYRQDVRSISNVKFNLILENLLKKQSFEDKIIVCGTNYKEICCNPSLLKRHHRITALDMSRKALKGIEIKLPKSQIAWHSMEKTPFDDNTFHTYVALRSITSLPKHKLAQALEESIRIAKKQIIISIPNGYLNAQKKLIKGMYIADKKYFDLDLPYSYLSTIKNHLVKSSIRIQVFEIESEIIVSAEKI